MIIIISIIVITSLIFLSVITIISISIISVSIIIMDRVISTVTSSIINVTTIINWGAIPCPVRIWPFREKRRGAVGILGRRRGFWTAHVSEYTHRLGYFASLHAAVRRRGGWRGGARASVYNIISTNGNPSRFGGFVREKVGSDISS